MGGDRIEYDHTPHSQGQSIQKLADFVTKIPLREWIIVTQHMGLVSCWDNKKAITSACNGFYNMGEVAISGDR